MVVGRNQVPRAGAERRMRTFFIILSVTPMPAKAPHREPERTSASPAVKRALSPPPAPLRARRTRRRFASGSVGPSAQIHSAGPRPSPIVAETAARRSPAASAERASAAAARGVITSSMPGLQRRHPPAPLVAPRRLLPRRSPSSSSSARCGKQHHSTVQHHSRRSF